MKLVDAISDPALVAQAAAVWLALGFFGSKVEALGVAIGSPRLIRIGKALEAIFSDLPKLRGRP